MAFTMEEVKDFDQGPGAKISRTGKLARAGLILLVTVVLTLIAAALSGVIVSLSANASVAGLQIVFDPQITLGYVAVAYLTGYFNELSKNQQYKLFLFALLLSFILNFIQGALTLALLVPALKKLKLV